MITLMPWDRLPSCAFHFMQHLCVPAFVAWESLYRSAFDNSLFGADKGFFCAPIDPTPNAFEHFGFSFVRMYACSFQRQVKHLFPYWRDWFVATFASPSLPRSFAISSSAIFGDGFSCPSYHPGSEWPGHIELLFCLFFYGSTESPHFDLHLSDCIFSPTVTL